MRVFMPLNTTWAAFCLAILLLCLGAIIFLQSRHLISTRRALYFAIATIGSVATFYIPLYAMGIKSDHDHLFWSVRWALVADWFSVALILANLSLAGWVIYSVGEGTLTNTRGLFLSLVSALISTYLIVLWALLPLKIEMSLPSWVTLPTQPDPFNFALEVLLFAALTKTTLDLLKNRISIRHMLIRSGVTCLVTALAVIGWYSGARILVMPTVSWDIALLFGVTALPLLRHKRGRWLRPVPVIQSVFALTLLVPVIFNNYQPLALWEWATANSQGNDCGPVVSVFKAALSLNPKLTVPAQKIALCDNRRTTPLDIHPHKIVFKSDRAGKWSLFTMNEDGSDQTQLNNSFMGEMIYGISWSPDGARLAFTTQSVDASSIYAWYIYAMNENGSQLTLLKSAPYLIGNPHWLPDGQHLTYGSYVSGKVQLYMMNNDGGADHLFTNMDESSASAWSPNAPYIVFRGIQGNEPPRIFVRSLDGTVQYALTTGNHDGYDIAWSLDGQSLAFTATDKDSHRGIATVGLDGTDLRQLTKMGTRSEGDNWHPTWSPDGQLLAFSSDRGGKSGIYIMNADGSDVRCLACGSYNSESPTWQPSQ